MGKGQMLRFQPDLIVQFEYIFWGRGRFCRMVDGRRCLGAFLMEGADPLLGTLVGCGYRLGWEKLGMIAEESFIGGHPQSVIYSVIVDCRSNREPLGPIVLLSCRKQAKVLLDPLVLAFR